MNEKLTRKEIIAYSLQALTILIGIIAIAYCSYLKSIYLISITAIALAIIPFVIKAWIKQKRSYAKFEQICNYLTNIIPVFIQKTKIRYALGELFSLAENEVKEAINEAIEYIDNTKDDSDLLKNGLAIIEKRFNNSRIKSVHKFLLDVENNDSFAYKEIAENLMKDVEGWIKRTYAFQKDLRNRQIKILFLCISTLLMNVLFIYVYSSNDIFSGFVNNKYYQITTFLFICLVLTIIVLLVIKLNPNWLIEDVKNYDEEKLKEKYRNYKKGKPKLKAFDIVLASLIFGIGIYFFIIDKRIAAYCFGAISLVAISQKARRYHNLKQIITKELTVEFPMWLRQIALSLGNLTVLNAIETSTSYASYPLRREIRNFLQVASKNPTAISPYNEFLEEYAIDDVKPSMRVLFAVNSASKAEMKQRVAMLIERNQELLAKSEKIRNYDSISGVETLGYLPTIIFCVHMMSSMVIMFNFMIQNLGGII